MLGRFISSILEPADDTSFSRGSHFDVAWRYQSRRYAPVEDLFSQSIRLLECESLVAEVDFSKEDAKGRGVAL